MTSSLFRIQARYRGRLGVEVGVFVAVDHLRRAGRLATEQEAPYLDIDDWFQEHLPNPDFYADGNTVGAVTWFKTPLPTEMQTRIDRLCAILAGHEVAFDVAHSDSPGAVIFEDRYQVGVIPAGRGEPTPVSAGVVLAPTSAGSKRRVAASPIRHVLFDADGVLQEIPGGWYAAMEPHPGDRARDFLHRTWKDELQTLAGRGDYLPLPAAALAGYGVETPVEVVFEDVWHRIVRNEESFEIADTLRRNGYGIHLGTNQEKHRGGHLPPPSATTTSSMSVATPTTSVWPSRPGLLHRSRAEDRCRPIGNPVHRRPRRQRRSGKKRWIRRRAVGSDPKPRRPHRPTRHPRHPRRQADLLAERERSRPLGEKAGAG